MKQIIFPLTAQNVADVVAERDAEIERLNAECVRLSECLYNSNGEAHRLRSERAQLWMALDNEDMIAVSEIKKILNQQSRKEP